MIPDKRKTNWALILGILLGIAGLAVILLFGFPKEITQVKNKLLPRRPATSEAKETIRVKLYFGSRTTKGLAIEEQEIARLPNQVDQVREIIIRLLAGPQGLNLVSAIPAATSLMGLYIDQGGCAYLDFSAHISRNHPGGCYAELQTIYSVVNTLTANFDFIKKVKFLVNGAEIDTLAGHIDTRYAFSTN